MTRRSYEQSFDDLTEATSVVGDPRPRPERCPRHDDPDPGPSLLRVQVADTDFLDLTLPGLFVTGSDFRQVSFAGSDLSLSTMHWSDFSGCDFADCDLSRTDLRGCTFEACSFAGADLRGADLRHSSFGHCSFRAARLDGALLAREHEAVLDLEPAQAASVAWQDPGGAELPPA
jgi:uncharacterized protein YjbI with pentapeptide repeats